MKILLSVPFVFDFIGFYSPKHCWWITASNGLLGLFSMTPKFYFGVSFGMPGGYPPIRLDPINKNLIVSIGSTQKKWLENSYIADIHHIKITKKSYRNLPSTAFLKVVVNFNIWRISASNIRKEGGGYPTPKIHNTMFVFL